MGIKNYLKNLFYFPHYVFKSYSLNMKLNTELFKTYSEIGYIKNDLNIIFRYLSGLELHPKMPERLIVNDYRDVSKDHLVRYLKACEFINTKDKVLDFACGCGYGSSCIKINANPSNLTGCDIDYDTIEFAKRFFQKQGIEFNCFDVSESTNFENDTFDKIVSFETIEHIPIETSEKALQNFYNWLKPEGKLICSVPNQLLNPFETANNKYHFRHFTHVEFKSLLESVGFTNIQFIEDEVSKQNNIPLGKEFDSIIAIAIK